MIDLVSALDGATAKRIKQYPHPNNRASEAGHPCKRFLVAVRICQDKQALHGVGLQRIFDEGNLQERAVLRELEDAGIELVEQQRPFVWEKFQLSGKVDARIRMNGHKPPLDIKSCSPNTFNAIRPLEPLAILKSKYSRIRKYPAQILLYDLMAGEEEGCLLFKNKVSGEKIQKNFELTGEALVYSESILQKLTKVNEFVARKELPPVEAIEDCKGCAFAQTLCFPDQDYGPGYEILTDEEWTAKLDRIAELEEAAKEREELVEEVRQAFKGRQAIIGNWRIESKEYERVNYRIPEDVKGQFKEISRYWRTNIEPL